MPTRLDTGAAQPVHEVAHRQPFADGLLGVFLATWIDDHHALRHQQRRQRYVGRDRDITLHRMVGDVAIRHVRAAIHAHRRQVRMAYRQLQPLVRDEDRLQRQPIAGTVADLLHVPRRSVGIEPELQNVLTFRRLPVTVRPASDGVSVPLLKIAALIAAAVKPGRDAAYSAAAPVTCGVAIEVPL